MLRVLPEIMSTLTTIEQYALTRKILGLLYDPSYGPERSNSAILKDFSSIVDGPLERIGILQISEDSSPSLVKAIRASGLRRFLSLVALAHFSIPPASSRGRDPNQNYTSQLKLKRTGDPPISVLNTLPELLCSPLMFFQQLRQTYPCPPFCMSMWTFPYTLMFICF